MMPMANRGVISSRLGDSARLYPRLVTVTRYNGIVKSKAVLGCVVLGWQIHTQLVFWMRRTRREGLQDEATVWNEALRITVDIRTAGPRCGPRGLLSAHVRPGCVCVTGTGRLQEGGLGWSRRAEDCGWKEQPCGRAGASFPGLFWEGSWSRGCGFALTGDGDAGSAFWRCCRACSGMDGEDSRCPR
jgi:hypothetical protein